MVETTNAGRDLQSETSRAKLRTFFGRDSTAKNNDAIEPEKDEGRPMKWSMGVLNDRYTHEVPGSVLLLSGERNEPLGLRNAPARTSSSSLPSPYPTLISRRPSHVIEDKKKTKDGAIILEPQPDDSHNDPLNWPSWRRDSALLSLGFYCMVGGGMTPILAAGFTNVAQTYDVTVPKVALTTGLYMMGLGVGSVIASPTAILYGKRPVYLTSSILFIASSVWCATSPSYISLLIARIVQGISVSPVECLPSATVAEIFFLHERAYRIGIYTLLLLGGKNLIPLVSAVIIQSLGWQWVFWIVAIIVGLCWVLLFLFVPETFWDRTPRPKHRRSSQDKSISTIFGVRKLSYTQGHPLARTADASTNGTDLRLTAAPSAAGASTRVLVSVAHNDLFMLDLLQKISKLRRTAPKPLVLNRQRNYPPLRYRTQKRRMSGQRSSLELTHQITGDRLDQRATLLSSKTRPGSLSSNNKPWNGRLHYDNWFLIACRPFILFAYPAVLWSAIVYSCSVGWLIVLSESVAEIYRSQSTYNFSALSTGLIYLSPFIGGILGTAVAGKVSDIIVRAMSRRNGGLYEPEFRLIMAAPIAASTVIGLMGFGWSAEVHDAWIVPTIFFGVISFGCSLGSTTAITFCVDSYRAYAGEALVTLNFSKNIFHGLVFSLFFNSWLAADGSKRVFLALGGIQLALMLLSIPMYIFGKRARMWTVRKNFIEKF